MTELLLRLIQEGEKNDLAANVAANRTMITVTFWVLLVIIVFLQVLNLWAMYKLEKKIIKKFPKNLKDLS